MKIAGRSGDASDAAMGNMVPTDAESRKRLLRFLAVGGGTLGVQMAVFWASRKILSETVAFSASWVVSTATHYVANRFWALPSARQDTAKQFGEYLFTIAISYVINIAAFKALSALGVSELWALALAVPPSTVAVFLLLNYRVFRGETKARESAS